MFSAFREFTQQSVHSIERIMSENQLARRLFPVVDLLLYLPTVHDVGLSA